MLAWHFTNDKLRDGRPLPEIGETLIHTGPLIPCKSGYHASERLIDALRYAPGPHLWRVRLGGEIVSHDGDKVVATERTGLWRIDATDLLRSFARQCALDVAHLWDMPAIVRDYLTTGCDDIRDAASAAASAARDAAWDAASAAASAAWAAAWDAAWDAASAAASAARAAARAAASAAASDAARAAASAAWAAASAAASDAAWAAAWAVQNERITQMVTAEATRLGYTE